MSAVPTPSPNGESGIRTHAPLRTNGFQDRLVMTTSISLQACSALSAAKIILTKRGFPVNNFLHNFSFLFLSRIKAPIFKGFQLSTKVLPLSEYPPVS